MGCKINIEKDGFILGSQLEFILDQMADAIAGRLDPIDQEIEELRAETKRLRNELETERRIRLGMSRKGR